jgi:pilin isopeptide linkage protein/LPXTG-motif cell wall-anchored protein
VSRKNHPKWRGKILAAVLALVVAFGTFDASMLQAIAMTEPAVCGIEEHQHEASCYGESSYELICSTDAHTHTQGCEGENGEYVCGYADYVLHTHNEYCEYGCTLPEIKAHTHTGACVDDEGEYICGLEDYVLHTHTKGCRSGCDQVEVTEHNHSKACLQETGGELVCGKTEHEHTDACYEENEDAPLQEDVSIEITDDALSEEAEEVQEAPEDIPDDTEESALSEDTSEDAEAEQQEDAEAGEQQEEASGEIQEDEEEAEQDEEEITVKRSGPAKSAGSYLESITRAQIPAKKYLNGKAPGDKTFTFELYDSDDFDTPLTTATNDADGNITFNVRVNLLGDTDSGTTPGIYEYYIREVDEQESGYTYDDTVYTVPVAVENGNATVLESTDHYLGSTASDQYTIYMRNTDTNQYVRVYCIDRYKTQPFQENANKYWIPEVDPDNETVLAAVCHTTGGSHGAVAYDYWAGTDVKGNLKKLLYYFKNYPNAYSAAAQATLIWDITCGSDYVSSSNQSVITKILQSTTVPSSYKLVLFHASDGTYQPLAALVTSQLTETQEVVFENEYTQPDTPDTPTPYSDEDNNDTNVTVSVKKYLDGEAPGQDHIFTFELLENGKVIATGQNDAEGNVNIAIPYTFTKAGTYTYTLREVNDGQEGISYDDSEQTVKVVVSEEAPATTGTTYDFSASKYYGMTEIQEHYMSTTVGGTDIPVYCIDAQKEYPPDYSDLKSGRVTYKVITNPSNDTLEQYVGTVKDAGNTSENLRKLLYYLDTTGKNWDVSVKNNYIWTVTSKYTSGDFWDPVSQSTLNKIYANTVVPDNYYIALFYPSSIEGSTGYSLSQYQPLVVGYFDNEPVLVTQITQGIAFHNTTTEEPDVYKLPETGGLGTTPFTLGGGAILASALLYGFFYRRKRERRARHDI